MFGISLDWPSIGQLAVLAFIFLMLLVIFRRQF
jgi:hypothetical protein